MTKIKKEDNNNEIKKRTR